MALWGTIVNALAILLGGTLGLMIPKIRESVRTTVLQGMALVVIVLGLQMAFKTSHLLLMIISLVLGGIIGELCGIEARLERLGRMLEKKFGQEGKSSIATGFVTTTLIYCVGAMAILGAIDGGMRHNHDILYTKAMLDGFSAIFFASALGVGVLFSSLPVFLYQGAIALTAALFASHINMALLNELIPEISAVGGVLIFGIGLNILEVKRVNVANLLPSVVIAAIGAWLMHTY